MSGRVEGRRMQRSHAALIDVLCDAILLTREFEDLVSGEKGQELIPRDLRSEDMLCVVWYGSFSG
jgi:hypothetical protein